MHSWRNALVVAALAAGLALSAGGCYPGAYGTTYAAGAGAGGPPRAASPGAGRMQALGFGASGGLFVPADSAYADGLAEGFMWDIHASLWLGPYLAVQADFGRSKMVDRGDLGAGLGGQMTASPLTVSAIFSVPMPAYGMMGAGMPGVGFGGGDYYRWRFGGGVGTMLLSHTEYTDVPASINVVYMTGGAEWVIGFGDRIFAVADVYFGSLVEATQPSAWNWDLTSIATVRMGLEIGF